MNKKFKIKKNSRREFLKQSALASAFMIVPRHVLGGVNYNPPSDQDASEKISCKFFIFV